MTTKKEMMEILANDVLAILAEKERLQIEINGCFCEYGTLENPSYYDELVKKFEFQNGQIAYINSLLDSLKIKKVAFNLLVHEKDMNRLRKKYNLDKAL